MVCVCGFEFYFVCHIYCVEEVIERANCVSINILVSNLTLLASGVIHLKLCAQVGNWENYIQYAKRTLRKLYHLLYNVM